MKTLSISQARRIALWAQGFADSRPRGRVTVQHFRRVLNRMAILQLDAVNVLCRSHFLPVFARLGAYDQDRLDAWIWKSGENLEFLAHEASITQMDLYPLLQHRMNIERWKSGTRFQKEQAGYLRDLVVEVTDSGPLSVKDLKDPGNRTGPWWGWSKGKLGLEVLYRSGALAIADRSKSFLTRYDLPERIVPQERLHAAPLETKHAQREMLLLAARSLGVATAKDLADYFRLKMTACRPLLEELADASLLKRVQVEGWDDAAFLSLDAKTPKRIAARALLSPFDPVVWFRPRAARLFDFHYRIEIYVPEEKRKFGYYVLPFLLGETIVGRVDLKANRQRSVLEVKGAFLEAGQDADVVAPALAQTLDDMKQWLSLEGLSVGRRGNLARALSAACRERKS